MMINTELAGRTASLADASSPMPLYHQVYRVLRQRILDGVYPSGSRLVSEEELTSEFQVSRATIRRAVDQLVTDGLVSKQQGRGTFVRQTVTSVLGQRFRGSLRDLIMETTRTGILDVSVSRSVRIPERVAEALKLEDGLGTIVRRTRTMDGRPFAYTVNHLPDSIGSLASEEELREIGLMTLLGGKGINFTSAAQSIRAQLADVELSRALQVEFGAPVLFVERLLYRDDSIPSEFVQTWYRGDSYEFHVTLELAGLDDIRSQLA